MTITSTPSCLASKSKLTRRFTAYVKYIVLYTFCLTLNTQNSFAQNLGVNATGATPNASSIIDLNTGNTFTSPNGKGLLPPNVALTSITDAVTITSPVTSLWIYNTATAGTGIAAVVPGYYYWDGAKWVRLQTTASTAPDWSLLGNAGTTAGTNFIGTTDAVDWVIKTNNIERMRVLSGGNVGIGTTTPSRVFEVRNPALNPQLQIGTTSLLSNRGSILYGRSALWEVGSDISVNNSDNFFIAQASSGQYALAIDNNRNVGIGTITPTNKLSIVATATNTGFQLQDGSEGSGKALTSDATGKASWAIPASDVADVNLPILSGTNVPAVYTNYTTLNKGTYLVTYYNCMASVSVNYYLVASAQASAGVISVPNPFVWDFSQNKYYTSTPFIVKVSSATASVRGIVYHGNAGTLTDPGSPTSCSSFTFIRIGN